jgi:hypothetical protein
MPNTKDISMSNKKFKGMVYGSAGKGKTYFFLTWPSVYVLDFDSGVGAFSHRDAAYDVFPEPNIKNPVAWKKGNEKLYSIFASGQANGKIIWDTSLNNGQGGFVEKKVDTLTPTMKVIETVVLDGSSTFLDACMYQSMFIRATAKHPAGRTPAEQDWYPQMDEYKKFVHRLVTVADFGWAHVWVSAHEQYKELKAGEEVIDVKCLPDLTGKLSTKMGGAFDFVFRIEADNVGGKRRTRLLTQSRGMVECKNRWEEALELYEEPSYENLTTKLAAYFAKKKGEVK